MFLIAVLPTSFWALIIAAVIIFNVVLLKNLSKKDWPSVFRWLLYFSVSSGFYSLLTLYFTYERSISKRACLSGGFGSITVIVVSFLLLLIWTYQSFFKKNQKNIFLKDQWIWLLSIYFGLGLILCVYLRSAALCTV